MPTQRQHLHMSDAEVSEFLATHSMMVLGTQNLSGAPHMVTMGYAMRNGALIFTAYRKSQKAVNMLRAQTASALIEDWNGGYGRIKGALVYGAVHFTEDKAAIVDYLKQISSGLKGFEHPDLDFEHVAAKRYGVMLVPRKIVSWNHEQLNGAY